jgi:hypothetical protein
VVSFTNGDDVLQFNLAIPDLPEVSTLTKSILSGNNPSQKLPICVEISLKTSEGDSMILETWLLSMTEPTDHLVSSASKVCVFVIFVVSE